MYMYMWLCCKCLYDYNYICIRYVGLAFPFLQNVVLLSLLFKLSLQSLLQELDHKESAPLSRRRI